MSFRPAAAAVDAVERDRPEIGKIVQQMLDVVVLGLADRLVEAAAPACRRDHVPQADASLGKPLEPLLVGKRLQFLADRASDETPELVRRMGIISPGRKRGVARQAAEDEQPRIASSDRRKSGFDAHELTPTARAP